jgi:hypothetical protein
MAGKFRRRNYDPIPVRNPSALKRAATDEQNCHKYRTDLVRRTDPVTRQLPNGMISNFGFLRLGLLFVSIVRTDPFPGPTRFLCQ